MKRIIMGIAILYISLSMYGVVSADESNATPSPQSAIAQDNAASTNSGTIDKAKPAGAEKQKRESIVLACNASEAGACLL